MAEDVTRGSQQMNISGHIGHGAPLFGTRPVYATTCWSEPHECRHGLATATSRHIGCRVVHEDTPDGEMLPSLFNLMPIVSFNKNEATSTATSYDIMGQWATHINDGHMAVSAAR